MSSISLDISSHQLKKLGNGNKITIKPHDIGSGIKVKLPAEHVKALKHAQKSGKAYKLQLTTTEGGDLKKALKTIWRGYKQYVKPVVGPAIRKGLTTAVKVALPAAAVALGAPEAAPAAAWVANEIGDKAVNALGDATGAYGLKHKAKLVDNWSRIIHTQHPASNPALPLPDHSKANHTNTSGGRLLVKVKGRKPQITRGGSFLPAGY